MSEIHKGADKYQFFGRGQSESTVITFEGLLRLAVSLNCKEAQENRLKVINLVHRFVAGDPDMADELAANANSIASIHVLARETLAEPSGDKKRPGKKRSVKNSDEELQSNIKRPTLTTGLMAKQITTTVMEGMMQQFTTRLMPTLMEHFNAILKAERDETIKETKQMIQDVIAKIDNNADAMKIEMEKNHMTIMTEMDKKNKEMLAHIAERVVSEKQTEIPEADDDNIYMFKVVKTVNPNWVFDNEELKRIGKRVKAEYVNIHGKEPIKKEREYQSGKFPVHVYHKTDWDMIAKCVREHFALSDQYQDDD